MFLKFDPALGYEVKLALKPFDYVSKDFLFVRVIRSLVRRSLSEGGDYVRKRSLSGELGVVWLEGFLYLFCLAKYD